MKLKLPYKIFDAHLHIIDKHFPLVENQGFIPKEFTCNDYLNRMKDFELKGGAIVSESFQGFDQDYLCYVLQEL